MQRPVSQNSEGEGEENPLGGLEATVSCLWVLTPLSATVSLVLVAVGMATNQWLHTTEKMSNPHYNGTGEMEYLAKVTVSGLWMFCFTNLSAGEALYHCNTIDYFSEEVYSPDPTDSTLAIPYTVTKSIIFILLGSIFVLIGYIFCILGQCLKNKTRCSLIAGVIFIQTGLAMMCGLIMYIAIFKSEVGSKLRPRSQLRPAAFEYSYGYSFIVYVSGVVFTQLSGVSCIFLYLYRAQYDWRRKQLEDHKRGGRPGVNHYSHHIDSTELYPCRRHPSSYVNSNSASHYHRNASGSADQKRFYLSKDQLPTSPCSLHQTRSQSNSVKDVSTFYDFPPPPTISYQFPDQRNYRLPRDVTSNTMSTTADVAIEEFLSEQFESDYSPTIQRECEFVTFDLDQPLPLRAPSVVSINSNRNGRTDTLRRTTPV